MNTLIKKKKIGDFPCQNWEMVSELWSGWHMSHDDIVVRVEWALTARRKTKYYYSAHNFATTVSFSI